MKLKAKIAAVLTAAFMSLSWTGVAAYAAGETPTTTTATAPTTQQPEENTEPSLGAGAFHSTYAVSDKNHPDYIKKDTRFTIAVVSFIPINNYVSGLTENDFSTDKIFTIASDNESFRMASAYADQIFFTIKGNFLKVSAYYRDVMYTGKGSEFNYTLCYEADGAGVNIPFSFSIGECLEAEEEEDDEEVQEDLSVPSFILSNSSSYTIKAGTSQTINLNLKSVGKGTISMVSAMLSSSDNNIIVEDIGEKTSVSLTPGFSFKISVPESAVEGVYNLNLNINVFNRNGAAAGNHTYSIPVKVTSDVKTSALTVKSYETSKKTIRSGDKFSLTLVLENKCGIDLENVDVTLTNLDSSKFVLDGGFSKQTVNIKNGKTAKVKFPLVACAGISSVRETIGVQASYSINPQTPNNLETSVILTCVPEGEKQELGKHDLTMVSYEVSSGAVAENTRFTLSVTLENSSENKIENARISILGLDGIKFAINSGLTYKDFDIAAGKTKTFSFEIIGCKGISSIREVIPILIEYGTVSAEVSATVSCVPGAEQSGEDGQVFAPNIIIESYEYGNDFVTAGQTFPLSVKIKNTSGEAVIENLKVTINGGATNDGSIAYSPSNSSSSFFFERLGLKESTEISLDMLAKADAVPNSYPVDITFTYEYSAGGKSYQANPVAERITIPLQQEDRLTINQPSYPNWTVMVGEMCYISTSLVNKGKSGVYNVTATVEGTGFDVSSGAAYYIGNINSGSEEYYDAQIIPNAEGEISGEIIVTYEDANGSEKEQRLPFSFSAMAMNFDDQFMDPGMEPGFTDPGMEPMPPESSGFKWLPVVIGAAVVIAIVVIIIIVVKKKKKRKMELEDEDEDI